MSPVHSSLRSDALGCLVVTHASHCEAQHFPAPSFSFHPPACYKSLFLCRVSWRAALPGQCRVSDSIRRVLSDLTGSRALLKAPVFCLSFELHLRSEALAKPSDVPSADVAICVQFLFVSVVLLPFNLSFIFLLCFELPLYFVVALFSVYSWSASSLPSFP